MTVPMEDVVQHKRLRTVQTQKSFVYERQKGVNKIPRTDVLGILEEAIAEQEWYIQLTPELENIKNYVLSKEYLEKAGQMAYNWWKDELDIVARRGWSANAQSNPMLKQARINLNQAILGYKISSILMQPFAIFDAMAFATSQWGSKAAVEILRQFSNVWINPKYAQEIISKSPALSTRQGGEMAIEENLKENKGISGLKEKFFRDSMTLLQKGDIKTAAGVQQGIENILKKYGIPNSKDEAEFFMNVVSGSNEISYRPHVLAKGELGRMWFTFQTFFLNRWGIVIHDLIKTGIITGKGATEAWKRFGNKLAALLGIGIFIGGSILEKKSRKLVYEKVTGNKLPNDSLLKTALLFIPTQIPYLGNVIEEATSKMSSEPVLIRTFGNLLKGGTSLATGKEKETKIKGTLKMSEAGMSLFLRLPGTAQFFDLLERLVPEKAPSSGYNRIPVTKPQPPQRPKL